MTPFDVLAAVWLAVLGMAQTTTTLPGRRYREAALDALWPGKERDYANKYAWNYERAHPGNLPRRVFLRTWLVWRRKYIWRLAEGQTGDAPGWNIARRRERYRVLYYLTVQRRWVDPTPRGDERPRLLVATDLPGLARVFGWLGALRAVTGHYSASRRATTWRIGLALAASFSRHHASLGWGGIAYNAMICDDGTIIFMRPFEWKGAHVAGHNTGNHGVLFPGTTGDQPTAAQRASFRWYLDNAHKSVVPERYRAPKPLRSVPRRGHHEWPGNPTACPGSFLGLIRKGE